MSREDGHRDRPASGAVKWKDSQGEAGAPHGYYLPSDDLKWKCLTADHHEVYLLRKSKPWHERRKHILIGELRRLTGTGHKDQRFWRAFPVSGTEFPEVLDNHMLALEYLKSRWEAALVTPEVPRPKNHHARPRVALRGPEKPVEPAAWIRFFGEDPFA